jgi:hypothetical protein
MGKQAPKVDTMSVFRAKIQELEKERDSRIFCMIHHGRAHICGPSMQAVFANRPLTGRGEKLEILMHSPGGHPDMAYQIMKFFRRRYKEVNIIVPLLAKSAATLMCLGADRIFMGEFGDLGPIDVQMGEPDNDRDTQISPLDEFKSLEYMRNMAVEWLAFFTALSSEDLSLSTRQALEHGIPFITGLMNPILGQIDPLEVGSFRRALAIAEGYGQRMLALTGQRNDDLVHELVWEYPAHSFCIDFEEADRLGLPVERLSEDHDQRFCEAIFNFEKGHYHGFASSNSVPKKSGAGSSAVPVKGSPPDGSDRGDNRSSDGGGKGKSPASANDTGEAERRQISASAS